MEVTQKGRDENLDNLRGFAMVWVILIHVLFWGSLFTNGYSYLVKSFLLFEMPLFFFITGASNSMSSKSQYWKFITRRFEHCLIPYWVFAFICSVLSIAVNIAKKRGGIILSENTGFMAFAHKPSDYFHLIFNMGTMVHSGLFVYNPDTSSFFEA